MRKVALKKAIILSVICFAVFASATTAVFAATTATTSGTTSSAIDATTSATTVVTTSPTASATTATALSTTTAPKTTAQKTTAPTTTTASGSISIAPDSVLYPLKLMVESVQTALTFTPEGKAELLVSFANKRLAEADLMTERNKQELVLSVIQAYVKTIKAADENAQEAATVQAAQDIKPILDSIVITEQSADNFVIKVTGTVPQNISDQLKTVVSDQVKKKIVKEAAAATRDKVKEASQQVKIAEKQLAIAQNNGNDTLVKTASDALAAAKKSKDDSLALKNQVKAYKKEVVQSINQQEAAAGIKDRHGENGDEDDKSDEHGDKSDNHKNYKKQQKHQDELHNNWQDNHDEEGFQDNQDNQYDQYDQDD